MSAMVQECRSCSNLLFPARLFCPFCGGDSFSLVSVGHGTLEETTTLSDGIVLATLGIDGGPKVIARLIGPGAEEGQSVPLTNDPNTTSGLHAYIPVHSTVNEDHS
jgi:uncharacterized OB-fold protein